MVFGVGCRMQAGDESVTHFAGSTAAIPATSTPRVDPFLPCWCGARKFSRIVAGAAVGRPQTSACSTRVSGPNLRRSRIPTPAAQGMGQFIIDQAGLPSEIPCRGSRASEDGQIGPVGPQPFKGVARPSSDSRRGSHPRGFARANHLARSPVHGLPVPALFRCIRPRPRRRGRTLARQVASRTRFPWPVTGARTSAHFLRANGPSGDRPTPASLHDDDEFACRHLRHDGTCSFQCPVQRSFPKCQPRHVPSAVTPIPRDRTTATNAARRCSWLCAVNARQSTIAPQRLVTSAAPNCRANRRSRALQTSCRPTSRLPSRRPRRKRCKSLPRPTTHGLRDEPGQRRRPRRPTWPSLPRLHWRPPPITRTSTIR